jgi:hypothetical protein
MYGRKVRYDRKEAIEYQLCFLYVCDRDRLTDVRLIVYNPVEGKRAYANRKTWSDRSDD